MRSIAELRAFMAWSQEQMADYLGCTQPTVTRMEGGQRVAGPVARMSDRLDALIDDQSVSKGMGVEAVIGLAIGRRPALAQGWGKVEAAATFDDGEIAKVGGGL